MAIRTKFTFLSITYNQEDYIVEHLESIKHQIMNFGSGMDFQLIIADDCSKDKTIEYVNYWISKNEDLFWKINIVSDSANRGTCYNFTKVWELVEGDYSKLCAGDDVYSCNNLFDRFNELHPDEILVGIPLLLLNGHVIQSKSDVFNIIASYEIYKNENLKSRLEKISVINTPNSIIPVKCYKNERIFEFIRKYRVTEDFPLLIKMSEEYNPLTVVHTSEVMIYYRRTSNSTYIVKNNSFNDDKVEIFEYLISKAETPIDRFMLRNRLKCFQMHNKYLRRILNLNYYSYGIKILFNSVSILRKYRKVDMDIDLHQKHMNYIIERSKTVLESYNSEISSS